MLGVGLKLTDRFAQMFESQSAQEIIRSASVTIHVGVPVQHLQVTHALRKWYLVVDTRFPVVLPQQGANHIRVPAQ